MDCLATFSIPRTGTSSGTIRARSCTGSRQNVLGDALGLSTVHVSRLISELRAEGVVQWSGGRIDILDWRRLAEIAEFDPTYLRLQSEPV